MLRIYLLELSHVLQGVVRLVTPDRKRVDLFRWRSFRRILSPVANRAISVRKRVNLDCTCSIAGQRKQRCFRGLHWGRARTTGAAIVRKLSPSLRLHWTLVVCVDKIAPRGPIAQLVRAVDS